MKNYYKLFLATACLFIGNHNLQAQSFTYSMSTDSYTELTNPTVVSTDLANDLYLEDLSSAYFNLFGENFVLDGTSGLFFGKGGFIRAFNVDNTKSFIFDPMLTPLEARTSGSEISYQFESSSNGNILKVQFKNMGFQTGDPSDFANVQVWLYQATGKVEYRYGPSSTDILTFGGQSGPLVGIYLFNSDFSLYYDAMCLTGNAANPTANLVSPFSRITGMPTDGTVYEFTPVSAVSLEENQLIDIKLYPNPAKNELTIEGDEEITSVEIIDVLGKTIKTEKINGVSKTISITDLNIGVYVARIHTPKGIVLSKFMKQ